MANWCFNTLFLTGSEENVNNAKIAFKNMAQACKVTGEGQVPEFLTSPGQYMFDMDVSDEENVSINYTTKWSPNTDDMVIIAKHFGVDFELWYEETSNNIYGVTKSKDGELTVVDLEDSDFESYTQDDETEMYTFDGEEYEVEDEILECLLRRRLYAHL